MGKDSPIEACKQCNRIQVPEVKDILKFELTLELLKDIELKLLFCIDEKSQHLHEILKARKQATPSTAIVIGPEGDFTTQEIELAKKIGFITASLGCRILRAETAGLYILSVLDYEFGTHK